jgi:hypothetical protein
MVKKSPGPQMAPDFLRSLQLRCAPATFSAIDDRVTHDRFSEKFIILRRGPCCGDADPLSQSAFIRVHQRWAFWFSRALHSQNGNVLLSTEILLF